MNDCHLICANRFDDGVVVWYEAGHAWVATLQPVQGGVAWCASIMKARFRMPRPPIDRPGQARCCNVFPNGARH